MVSTETQLWMRMCEIKTKNLKIKFCKRTMRALEVSQIDYNTSRINTKRKERLSRNKSEMINKDNIKSTNNERTPIGGSFWSYKKILKIDSGKLNWQIKMKSKTIITCFSTISSSLTSSTKVPLRNSRSIKINSIF